MMVQETLFPQFFGLCRNFPGFTPKRIRKSLFQKKKLKR